MGVPRKLSASEVLAICRAYAEGTSMEALAQSYGVHYEAVRQVVHGRTYKEIRRPAPLVRRPGGYARRAA